MAYIYTQNPVAAGLAARIAIGVSGAFAFLGKAMILNSTAYARLEKVQRLQAMSDEELAELGLTRNEIVRHVFHDLW